MQTKLILCSHGDFAQALVTSAEMITGKMPDIEIFSLLPGMSMEDFQKCIIARLEITGLDTRYLCLIDLYGGTPCTTILSLMKHYQIDVVTGLNLAMLIEVYSMMQMAQDCDLTKLAYDTLTASGRMILHSDIQG